MLVWQPADHPQHVELLAEDDTWVSTRTREALARGDARKRTAQRTDSSPNTTVNGERECNNKQKNKANSRQKNKANSTQKSKDAVVHDDGVPILSLDMPVWRRATHTCNDVYQVDNRSSSSSPSQVTD